MVNIVEKKGSKIVSSTLIIAKGVELEHRAIISLVDKYENDLKEFGLLTFEMRKSKGRPVRFFWLNEEQATFIITLMKNSKIVVAFKKHLTKEFFKLRKALEMVIMNQKNHEWLEKRETGKQSRLIQTDSIKNYVDYANSKGSQNAKRYYTSITNMENKALFFLEQKYPNVRNCLSGHQLETISNADRIISRQLQRCVDEGIDYHDGYKMAKNAVESFAELIGKTIVPMDEQKQLI